MPTQALAPTSFSMSPLITEGTHGTLSWSGAQAGEGNTITGYELQVQNSDDGGLTWDGWYSTNTYTSTLTYGSTPMSAPIMRGSIRMYRMRTLVSSGASYYSDWSTTTSLTKNKLPTPPTVFEVTPELYETPIVLCSWSGTIAGTSAIKYYIIQKSTSEDQSTWSAYTAATTKTSTALSGTANISVSSVRGMYTRFRLCVQDALDGVTDYVTSNVVRHTTIPNAPVITAPTNMGKSYNVNPRFLIATGGMADGHTQRLRVKIGGAAWVNSIDNPEQFSVGGDLNNGVKTIYQMQDMPVALRVVQVRALEDATNQQSPLKSAAFSTLASPFTTIMPGQLIMATDILTIRTAVDNVRVYYGLSAAPWSENIIAKQTQIKNWTAHITQIRQAIMQIVQKINSHDGVTTFDVTQFTWIPFTGGRPSAAIMNQIQETLLIL
jgi:hypothetical protein